MHHKSRGGPLTKSIKGYKTIVSEDVNNYPELEVQDTVNCIPRTDRKDLYLEKKYFFFVYLNFCQFFAAKE